MQKNNRRFQNVGYLHLRYFAPECLRMTRSEALKYKFFLSIERKTSPAGELIRYRQAVARIYFLLYTPIQAFFNIQSISVSVTRRSNCSSSSVLQA